MIKTFKYKEIVLSVKTNFLKDSKVYFPKDIQDKLEYFYKELFYDKPSTNEQKLIMLWKALQSEGIKVFNMKIKDLTHEGTTMTEMTTNSLK